MRRVPRFPVNLDVNLLSGSDTKQGVITSLGLKGAFVTMPAPVQVNPLVTMRFAPPKVPQSRMWISSGLPWRRCGPRS
jgi:hypothetical protein